MSARGAATRIGVRARHVHNRGMATSILIVDDHPSFRAAARRLLESEGYDVIGEEADGESGVGAAASLSPDVVLLDVHLPGIDGFETASRIRAAGNGTAVILTSSRDASDFGPLVAASGARGFVAKGELSGAALRELLS